MLVLLKRVVATEKYMITLHGTHPAARPLNNPRGVHRQIFVDNFHWGEGIVKYSMSLNNKRYHTSNGRTIERPTTKQRSAIDGEIRIIYAEKPYTYLKCMLTKSIRRFFNGIRDHYNSPSKGLRN